MLSNLPKVLLTSQEQRPDSQTSELPFLFMKRHWLIKLYVSKVQFCDTSSVYLSVCLTPKVKSPFITIYLTLF